MVNSSKHCCSTSRPCTSLVLNSVAQKQHRVTTSTDTMIFDEQTLPIVPLPPGIQAPLGLGGEQSTTSPACIVQGLSQSVSKKETAGGALPLHGKN